MTPGDLFWLAAIMSVSLVVMFLIYQGIFSVRTKSKTYTMHEIYRDGAVSPSGSEWETGKCEICGKEKPLHTGYGQCYACIHDAEDHD